MKPTDNVENVIKNDLTFAAGAELHDRMLNDVLNAQEKSRKTHSGVAWPNLRGQLMRSPLTKLAVAASVIVACAIGLSLWTGTQSGIALADVLARVENVKAFRSQWSDQWNEDPNKPYSFYYETRGTWVRSQEYGIKSKVERLDPYGRESTFEEVYRSPDRKTLIVITPKQKKYWRVEFDDSWAQQLQEQAQERDPLAFLKKILGCKYESMGRATMDGIEVEGFQTTDPNYLGNDRNICQVDVKMWVDVKTRLPVRYEEACAWFDQMGDKIIKRAHFVMHDFQWDVPVEAAEFEPPVIPDDYTGTVVKWPAINEENAIQGLKQCLEFFGKYPESITECGVFLFIRLAGSDLALRSVEKSETPAAVRLKEELKGLSEDDKVTRLSDVTTPIRSLARFYFEHEWDKKDPAYYGKSVTPKDADKVLLRWRVSDTEYRVIFGDLHAETVSPEKLAELEKTLPR
jgi:hypothetical protein